MFKSTRTVTLAVDSGDKADSVTVATGSALVAAGISSTAVVGGGGKGSKLPAKALQAKDVRIRAKMVMSSALSRNINFLQYRSLPHHPIIWIIDIKGIKDHNLIANRLNRKEGIWLHIPFLSWLHISLSIITKFTNPY
jgi:hypothetical protein